MSYKKDRKVLKRVDYGAAKNSLLGMLAALLVFALVFSSGDLYTQFQLESIIAGAAVLAVTAYRIFLVVRFDQLYGAAPARWRRLFGLGLVLHATVWGALPAWLFWVLGADFKFFIVVIYNTGVTTALGSSWMAGLRVRQAYIVLMFAPVIASLLLVGQLQEALLAVLLAVYVYYLFQLYRGQYETFWHALARERRGPTGRLVHNDQGKIAGQDIQLSLVYRLAHELRTPMNSLMGMMSLLEDTRLDDEQKEYLQVAGQSGKLLLAQIDDVLDYSRILSRRINLSPDFFDLRTAIEQALDAYGPIAQSNNLELSCVIDRLLPRRIHADRERVMQVLSNLFSNAIKFSDHGEIRLDVDYCAVEGNRGTLQVRVSDQGIGMEPEQLKRLFEDRFLDGDEDTFSGGQGGFGLLVCQGLIRAMGGQIGADSTPGEGTSFWFSIPVQSQPDMRESEQLIRRLNGVEALVTGAAKGTVTCLQEEFEALESQCLASQSYEHALQTLRVGQREHSDIGLLLVDSYGGFEHATGLCRQVLDDPTLNGTRLVLLASIDERGHPQVQQLTERGVQILVRPVHRTGLRQTLHRLLELQQQQPVADAPLSTPAEWQQRKLFRLLLVEDNEVNQLVTRGMLNKLGYQVKTVNDGVAALGVLEKEAYDLVLMDCMMPELDGFAVTRRLRQQEQDRGQPRTPVVAVTANTAEGVQARCLAAGMDDFLAKPVHLEALETVLRRWLPDQGETDDHEDEDGL